MRHPARHRVAPLHDLGGVATTPSSAPTSAASTRRSTASAAAARWPSSRSSRSATPATSASARSSRRSRTRRASTATTCPTWTTIAEVSHEYYNNDLRGGEGHMEVGKLILNVVHVEGAHDAQREALRLHAERRASPTACSRSSPRRYPGHHLLPGRDERRRRVELLLARADVPVQGEAGRAAPSTSARSPRTASRASRSRPSSTRTRSSGARSTRRRTCTAATTRTSSPRSRRTSRRRAASAGARASRRSRRAARPPSQKTPHITVNLFQTAVEQAPVVAARVKEDLTMFRELRAEKKRSKSAAVQTMDAAAEE